MSCPALFFCYRDAVAKILYSLLFHWLTERINAQVYPHQHTTSISILDIYGFEVHFVCPLSQWMMQVFLSPQVNSYHTQICN